MAEFNPRRPFTFQQAVAAGISAAKLKNPAKYQRVFRGVYADAGVTPSIGLRAEAALLLHPPGAFLSHTTAAALQGVAVPDDPHVHVTVSDSRLRRRRPGVRNHVRAPTTTHTVAGLPVSSGADLFTELAQMLPLLDLVVAGDVLVKQGQVRPQGLSAGSRRGSSQARRAASLVRARVESPMETRVRLLLVWAGFAEPEVNLSVPHGAGTYRLDLSWPDLRLAVEYDGQQHRTDLDQWHSDIHRREWLHRSGWTVVTLVARDVYRQPAVLLDRVYRAWVECGGAPFARRAEWCHHFAVPRAA